MGGVSVPGAGGKRSFDVDINLVPFIDMMSCLLAFLMLTAVWNRLAKIDIEQVIPKASQNLPEQEPPKVKKIQLMIDANAYVVNIKDGDEDSLPVVLRRNEEGKMPAKKLQEKLKEMQDSLPKEKNGDKHSAILLVGRDKVNYADVVVAMDVAIGLKLTGISLGTDETVPALTAAVDGKVN